jgi:hypothetical protein
VLQHDTHTLCSVSQYPPGDMNKLGQKEAAPALQHDWLSVALRHVLSAALPEPSIVHATCVYAWQIRNGTHTVTRTYPEVAHAHVHFADSDIEHTGREARAWEYRLALRRREVSAERHVEVHFLRHVFDKRGQYPGVTLPVLLALLRFAFCFQSPWRVFVCRSVSVVSLQSPQRPITLLLLLLLHFKDFLAQRTRRDRDFNVSVGHGAFQKLRAKEV